MTNAILKASAVDSKSMYKRNFFLPTQIEYADIQTPFEGSVFHRLLLLV